MANFIEEFYYGNIDPQTMGRNEHQIQKVMKLLATNEEQLTEHLQGRDKTMFLEYVDAWGVVMGSCTADNFINGFRLGAKFAYDTFVGADHLVTDSGKGA